MANLKNITGALLIDATATFLNGAGLRSGEDKNNVIPKTYWEDINNKKVQVPYVSAQSWRRWLRDTSNEENNWSPSELKAIAFSAKGSTNKIATELNPIMYPEDDLFGYMKSGGKKEESVQRTSPFRSSILKGVRNSYTMNTDDAYVFPKNGTPLPYSTEFYSAYLEGFFNLEYYRLGVYTNYSSKVELSKEILEAHQDKLNETVLPDKAKRYELKNAEDNRKANAKGLLKGLAYLRGGAKQAAFGADVSPKVLIIAGMESANPVFNNIFQTKEGKAYIDIDAIKEIQKDYAEKLATPIYIGIRKGFVENEEALNELDKKDFVIGTPISIVEQFNAEHLK